LARYWSGDAAPWGARLPRFAHLASFFTRIADGFLGTPAARSPWNTQRLHGRVINGMLAHAIEAAWGDRDFLPARLTTDLYRMPEYGPIRVETRMVRDGRRIKVIDAEFFSGEVSAARASCQLLRRSTPPDGLIWSPAAWEVPAPTDLPPPPPGASGPVGTSITISAEPGQRRRRWFSETHALIEGEPISPFARVAMACDMTNGIDKGVVYINSDINLFLQRERRGEWIGFDGIDHQASDGIDIGACRLYDLEGPIGTTTVCGIAQQLAG
jgi:hypothetical protein